MFVVKRRLGITAVPAPASRRLTYSEKFSRLATRWRDPQWRDYAMLLLAGKALGIALLFGLVIGGPALIRSAMGTSVHAQEPAPAAAEAPAAAPAAAPDPYKAATAGDIINPINTAWVLLGA
ncbi:MAG TPA: hypothetical protein VFK70_04595, partial [Vicinamibacteria bacterium]|nr:hypothetical protein [Vicinamibacteria bacterium]